MYYNPCGGRDEKADEHVGEHLAALQNLGHGGARGRDSDTGRDDADGENRQEEVDKSEINEAVCQRDEIAECARNGAYAALDEPPLCACRERRKDEDAREHNDATDYGEEAH